MLIEPNRIGQSSIISKGNSKRLSILALTYLSSVCNNYDLIGLQFASFYVLIKLSSEDLIK